MNPVEPESFTEGVFTGVGVVFAFTAGIALAVALGFGVFALSSWVSSLTGWPDSVSYPLGALWSVIVAGGALSGIRLLRARRRH